MFTPIPLNLITFALPARQFVIHCSVTVNESLPKVTEFALRLIRLCEDIDAEQLSHYFGFTNKETRLLLESLVDQSLIEFDGTSIRLTPYAESKFYTDDDLPRFSVVKPRTDSIDFDLLTFHPLTNGRGKKSPAYACELPIDQAQIGESTHLAEQAYQNHFQRILKAKEKTNDKIDIYKISNVKSDKLFGVSLDVGFLLNEELEVERQIAYDDEAPQEYRLGVESAVSDALRSTLVSQKKSLEDFVERFDDKLVGQFLSKKGFDLQAYVRTVHVRHEIGYAETTQPLIGNMYMPDNAAKIITAVKKALSVQEEQAACNLLTSIVWLAPEYRFWGRSKLFDDFYFSLQKELPQANRKKTHFAEEVKILYPGTRQTIRNLQHIFWSKQEKSLHFHEGELAGGRIEILLMPLRFACVLFHYAPAGNAASLVPLGFMTTDQRLIKEAQIAINEATDNGKRYVGMATYGNNHGAAHNELPYKDVFSFLNYCSI
jgi:hypothetical protein